MSQTKVHSNLPEAETTPTKTAAYYPRPELLTLQGLYSTSKSVYATHMPSAAAKLIGGVSKSLFKASTAVMVKVIPGSASTEWKSLENGEVDLDALLASYLTVGDETIDTFINASTDRFCQAYTNFKDIFQAKFHTLKEKADSLVEKVTGVSSHRMTDKLATATTQVSDRLATAKIQVSDKFEKTKAVVELVKENVEPVKDVLREMATSAQAEVTEKGYVEFAKDSAETIRDSGLEVIETYKAKGTVEGVKDISQQVLSNVVNKLQEAKNKNKKQALEFEE